jgi:hypothetical protein
MPHQRTCVKILRRRPDPANHPDMHHIPLNLAS